MNGRFYTSDALYVSIDERGQAFIVCLESVSRDTPPDRGTGGGGEAAGPPIGENLGNLLHAILIAI